MDTHKKIKRKKKLEVGRPDSLEIRHLTKAGLLEVEMMDRNADFLGRRVKWAVFGDHLYCMVRREKGKGHHFLMHLTNILYYLHSMETIGIKW